MSIQPLGNLQIAPSASGGVGPFGRNESSATPSPTGVAKISTDAPQPDQKSYPVSREQTEDAVKRIKEFVQPINDSIQFSLDEDTGFTVVKVIDVQTKEVLRQIPSEEAINIAKALDKLRGLLIQSKA